MNRRHFCKLTGSLVSTALVGCGRDPGDLRHIAGGFTGIAQERGHTLRDGFAEGTRLPARTRQAQVLILGGGVAGLAAARALRLRGQEDFALLELEDSAGGNARGGMVGGIACPLGAHYLPIPSDDAPEVQDLLEELGLRQRVAGRWRYDERHLCHSPQERLLFQGEWQDGLLPVQGVSETTLAQYRRFAALVGSLQRTAAWHIPMQIGSVAPVKRSLAAMTFIAYLLQNGLDDPHLHWYLDYCCRDDYGAGIATVSAWAGIHYFASRHGFHAPGDTSAEHEGLLTWPEGNAWLTTRLAAPLGERLHSARVVLRVASLRHGVEVDAWDAVSGTFERWQARQAVVALPIFVAARVVENPPAFLHEALARMAYAPWLVANLHIEQPLHDRPGAAPSWDNVLYGLDRTHGGGLGYVDATHQSLLPVPGATVLTHYRALGDVPGNAALRAGVAGRRVLGARSWADWRQTILTELAQAHPDLPSKATRLDITRYGHAMSIPLPQADGQIGLWPPRNMDTALSKSKQSRTSHPSRPLLAWERLRFAHSDWAGYSVFEEAFAAGNAAGDDLGR